MEAAIEYLAEAIVFSVVVWSIAYVWANHAVTRDTRSFKEKQLDIQERELDLERKQRDHDRPRP